MPARTRLSGRNIEMDRGKQELWPLGLCNAEQIDCDAIWYVNAPSVYMLDKNNQTKTKIPLQSHLWLVKL